MGVLVRCPACGHQFHIHGYEQHTACRECDALFNPQRHLAGAEAA